MKDISLILIIFLSFLNSMKGQFKGCQHETESDSLFHHGLFNCGQTDYDELSKKFTIDYLLEKAKTGSSIEKMKAAKILTIKEDESTFPVIHQLLFDEDEGVVSSTITYLRMMNREESAIPLFSILQRREEFENGSIPFYAIGSLKAICDSSIIDSLIDYHQNFNAVEYTEKRFKEYLGSTIEFIQQFHESPESRRDLLLAEVSKIGIDDWILDKIVEENNNEFWLPILKEQSRGTEKFQKVPGRILSLLKARVSMNDTDFNDLEQAYIKRYILNKN